MKERINTNLKKLVKMSPVWGAWYTYLAHGLILRMTQSHFCCNTTEYHALISPGGDANKFIHSRPYFDIFRDIAIGES